MNTRSQNGHPPAHLLASVHVHERQRGRTLVSVRKEMKPWRRVEFFVFLASQMAAHDPPIPDLQALAELAQINSSTLSRWKTGKTRPNLDTLYALADALGIARAEMVERAGILDDGPPPGRDATAAGDDETVRRIRQSKLSRVQQDRLISTYRAELSAAAQRKRAEELAEAADRDRRIRETIELLEAAAHQSR